MDIDFDDTSFTSTPLSSVSSAGSYKVPHVLITLQLEENQPLDARQCARWLDKFPLLAKWVKVEAVFPSYSTLMISSVPMPIWDMLPDHLACSFIGYVTSPKIGGPSFPEEVLPTQIPTVNEASCQIYEDIVTGDDPSVRAISLTRKDEKVGTEEEGSEALSDADATVRGLQGFTPSGMVTSAEVLQAARRFEHDSRNRSGGPLRSKTSNVTPLRWEWKTVIPPRVDITGLDEDNDNYPHEYEDEDADAADDRAFWISSRRPGAQKSQQNDLANEKDTILEPPGISGTAVLVSPIAVKTTPRDRLTPKIQNLQQPMHLNLPNLPQIPRFDKMPALPNDQSYLTTAPIARRINNLVGNNRLDSAKEQDHKWCDTFSGSIPALPPAYEDIFHQGGVDAKRALIVQVAADNIAGNKYTEMFDQAESSTTVQKRSKMLETVKTSQRHTITREQQDQLRLAHAEKVRRLSRDRNIFFIWVPMVVLIMLAILYNRVPKARSEA